MKFKKGDKIWYYFVGLVQAEIMGVYQSTNRYKVKHNNYEHFVSANKVYESRKEYIIYRVHVINNRIDILNKEKKKLLDS